LIESSIIITVLVNANKRKIEKDTQVTTNRTDNYKKKNKARIVNKPIAEL
jgi:hypothetical protein